jgi:hypothetical protein
MIRLNERYLLKNNYFSNIRMIPNIKIEIKLESIVENNELKNQRK